MISRRRTVSVVAGLMLMAWFSFAGLVDYDRTSIVGDLAEYVNNPVRLLNGEWPYRDFWLLHPPGEVLLPAAVYRLGFGMNAVLLVSVAINMLVGVAAYCVGRMASGSTAEGILAGVLVFFSGVPFIYGGCVYLHAYCLCLLLGAGFLIRYLQDHRRWSLLLAGVAIGCGMVFKLYLAGAAGAALLATVFCEARRRGCRPVETARSLAICLAGTLIVTVATAVCLADLWPSMWYAVAVDSVSHATSLRPPYGHKITGFWPEIRQVLSGLRHDPARWNFDAAEKLSRFVELVTIHALPFLIGGMWLLQRRKADAAHSPRDWSILFLLTWGGFTFIRAYLRGGNITPLVQSVTPLLLALALLLRPLWGRWRETRIRSAWWVAAGGAILAVGAGQLALVVTVQKAFHVARTSPVAAAPFGALAFADETQAAEVQNLITAVLEHSQEGEHIFVTAWNAPPLYALTRRRNPTYYDSLIDLCHRPAEEKQRQICRALRTSDVRLIVHRPGWATGSNTFENSCPLIDACLKEEFEQFRQIGPYLLYRPRNNGALSRRSSSEVR